MRPVFTLCTLLFAASLSAQSLEVRPRLVPGTFDLRISASEKVDMQVNIATAQGTSLYEELTPQFYGEYRKELDMSKLKTGVYFVRVIAGQKRMIQKVFVQNKKALK